MEAALLGVGGLLRQVPVALVVVYQPPYVTTILSVEDFSVQRLLLGYLVQGLLFLGVGLLVRWLQE